MSPSPPVHPTFLGITGVTNTHPPAYSASRPPIIADTRPTGYDSKPIAYAGSVQCLVSEALRPVHFSANEPLRAGALRIQASALAEVILWNVCSVNGLHRFATDYARLFHDWEVLLGSPQNQVDGVG